MRIIRWTVKELAEITKKRIQNKFDANIAVTGVTGIGKSTFLWKFFHQFPDFKVRKHLIFKRSDMIDLIKSQKFGYVWNDELITSGYKRNFFDREQIELIQVLTKYRNHYNIVAGAVPVFFTLDKELLKLFGMHIHIIKRGLGIVHLPREGRMYTDDIWDVRINAKLEDKWSKKKQANPNFRIPYHKYTTFAGYVTFRKMGRREEALYEKLKAQKRGEAEMDEGGESSFYDRLAKAIVNGDVDREKLKLICAVSGKRYSTALQVLNRHLREVLKINKTAHQIFEEREKEEKKLKDPRHIKQREKEEASKQVLDVLSRISI